MWGNLPTGLAPLGIVINKDGLVGGNDGVILLVGREGRDVGGSC